MNEKTWLETFIENNTSLDDRAMGYMATSAVCKKILEEIDNLSSYDDPAFVKSVVKSVIEKLGVEIEKDEPSNIDKSRTEIITPTRIRCSRNEIIVYTETQIYPVSPKSSAALYFWNVHHDGPCKVSINKDGYIYLAEKAEIPRC